jgi:Fe-S-cluster containining protein
VRFNHYNHRNRTTSNNEKASAKQRLQLMGEDTLTEYGRTDPSLDFAVASVPMSCKKGCAACCKQLVSVSPQEVAAIAVAYPEKLLSKKKKIEEQIELLDSLVVQVFGDQAQHVLDNEEALETYSKKNEQLADLWWDKQVACVFLKEDNTCSIYAARPIACRGYYVRSDPKLCFDKDKPEVELYDFSAIRFLRLRLMEKLNGDLTLMYLPAALGVGLKAL